MTRTTSPRHTASPLRSPFGHNQKRPRTTVRRKKTMLKRFVYAALFVVTSIASARVVSYAPYTNRSAYPLEQPRENRYFALYELTSPSDGQLVLYDSAGVEEPRVIFPTNGSSAYIF